MMEIVFSDSACGGLKAALGFHRDRRPYGLSLALSVGDISEDTPGAARQEVLRGLWGPSPGRLERHMASAAGGLEEILRRSAEGEPARLWYSEEPDEMCGLCWMLARLDSLGKRRGPVGTVRLPRYAEREDGVLEGQLGWASVRPEDWEKFLPLEQAASPLLVRAAANRWRELQEENAPLRAVVNGRLVSVPEDFYDSFIRRELARMPDEFHEAKLIGNVLGRHQLGIGDGWAARRVEAMIRAGELEPVTKAPEDGPAYRRILRKL